MARSSKRTTVLIIEDEVNVRNFASRVLELEGYRVLQAGDGEKGVRLARKNRVSLVLLDLRLPEGDGWEVLEELKSDPELSAIPIIVFTAAAGVAQKEKALSMGAAVYLVKPMSATSLKKTVARVLRQNERH